MARRSGDGMDFEVTVDGRPGRRELSSLISKIRDLGQEAVDSGGKIDSANSAASRSYRNMVDDISDVIRAEERVETAVQNRKAAQSRAQTAQNGVRGSTIKNDNLVGQGDLIVARQITEETRAQLMLRQQENKDLEAKGRLRLLETQLNEAQERSIDRIAAKERKAAEDQERRLQRALASEERANLEQVRGVQAELTGQRRVAEAEAAQRLRYHQYQADSLARIEAIEARDIERVRRVARAEYEAEQATSQNEARREEDNIYNDYLAHQESGSVANLSATRYALYDIASTATVAGLAIASVGVYAATMATKFEYSMDGVQRAASLSETAAANLQAQLVDLTTEIPTNFQDIAEISQLGAQMNIASGDLDDFASTVSRFSATTNASIDTTSQTFGRLSNLLDVPASKFENLGSSIAKVGVESVATETEILSVTQQIAGAAAVYGFTADQVVGLGAAFSSLAIAPEAARGSVTRIFGDIEKAVAGGEGAVSEFARIMQTDAKSAIELWQSDPSAFFQKLVSGLSQSNTLLADLEAIGARDVRDQNLLQRLAGSPEVLNASLATSAQAFEDGTYLAEAYAVQTDNLQSKLQVLANTFNALAATAGGPLNEALKVGVDILQYLLDRFRDANPVVVQLIALIAVLAGGFLLFKAGTAAAIASLLAVQTVLRSTGASAVLTGINIASLRAIAAQTWGTMAAGATSVGVLSRSMETARYAALSLGKGLVVIAALQLAFEGITAVANEWDEATRSSAQNAESYFGDLSGLGSAMQEDTKALQEGKRAVEIFQASLPTMTDEQRAAKEEAAQLALVLGETGDAAVDASNKARISALAFGDASTEFLRGQLAQSEDFKNAAKDAAFVEYWNVIGADVDEAIKIAAQEGEQGVRDYFFRLENTAREAGKAIPQGEYWDVIGSISGNATGSSVDDNLDTFIKGLGGVRDVAQQVTNEASIMGPKIGDAGDAAAGAGDDAAGSVDDWKALKDAIEEVFSGVNTEGTFYEDIDALYTALEASGGMFNTYSEEGRKSFDAVQDAILSTIQYADVLGVSAQDSLYALFLSMQQNGIDTTLLLQQLSSSPILYTADIDVSALVTKLAAATGSTTGLTGAQVKLNKNMNTAAKNAQSAARATKDYGGSAKGAAKEVVTLSDYVSDLGKVFDMAFGFRYGLGVALDDVASKWNKVAESNADAVDKIRDYRNELMQMGANKAILEYQLEIAVKYGDNLRAGEIRAEISQLSQDMADKQAEIGEATSSTSKELNGNSDAAIANRATLRDLMKSYTDYIKELANTGMSQADLAAESQRLKAEFISQATAMGFSRREVEVYAGGFDDLTLAINRVPRNINVSVDPNPALRALAEIQAKKAEVAQGVNVPITSSFDGSGGAKSGRMAKLEADLASWSAQYKRAIASGADNVAIRALDRINAINAALNSGNYASGGFVPWGKPADRKKDNGVGILPGGRTVGLQGGEPIINNAARDMYGDQMFKDINSLRFRPQSSPTIVVQSSQGAGEVIAHLSPEDRILIDSLRTIINIGDQTVAASANRGNDNAGRRGKG